MSRKIPSASCPLPEEVQNQILSLRQSRGTLSRGRRPSLGLCPSFHLEPAGGKGPRSLRKWHLQVKHEVVKPFFRNTVMEAHCKRGDGTEINREKTWKQLRSSSATPPLPHPASCPGLSPEGAAVSNVPSIPNPRLRRHGAERQPDTRSRALVAASDLGKR